MSLFTRQEDREFYQAKTTVKTHSNNLVVLAHVQLNPFYRLSTCDITHVRKFTRLSPALPASPYCKRWEAGRWPGNEATTHAHTHTNISMHIVSFPDLHAHQYTKCIDIHTQHMQTQLQPGLPGHANINLVNILPYIYTMSVPDMHVNRTSTPSSAIQY